MDQVAQAAPNSAAVTSVAGSAALRWTSDFSLSAFELRRRLRTLILTARFSIVFFLALRLLLRRLLEEVARLVEANVVGGFAERLEQPQR